MRNKHIYDLIEERLGFHKKKQVIEWLLKNKRAQKKYHQAKAEQVALSLREDTGEVKPVRPRQTRALLKYAAVLVILFGLAFYFNHSGESTAVETENAMVMIATSIGEKEEVVLSDGTKVTVNANSVLSYPANFTGNTREVLLKGEAFFEVTENKEKPFIVNTNEGMDIKVLGTVFNVKSYPEDKKVETTLVSGKVQVVERKDNKTVLLYPSQRATYNKSDDRLIIDKVQTEPLISWKDGKLIYDEAPLREVIKDLEREYHVSFLVNSEELLEYKFKGVFDNLSIDQVLSLFELSSPIKCTLKQNYVILEKQK
ncbi:MAG: FecR family protein [Allomuricauda sp.]